MGTLEACSDGSSQVAGLQPMPEAHRKDRQADLLHTLRLQYRVICGSNNSSGKGRFQCDGDGDRDWDIDSDYAMSDCAIVKIATTATVP